LQIELRENHVEFGLFEDRESAPFTFSCRGCEAVVLHEHMSLFEVCLNDLPSFDYDLFKGQELDSVKVEPNIIKDEPCAVYEGYLTDCCGFLTQILSMPPLNGVENELDMDVEFDFCESRPSDGDRPTITVFMNPAVWKFFMVKKDLKPKSLRWYLLLQEFEFEVFDKG